MPGTKITTTTQTTTNKIGYRIEAKPSGGFIAVANDPTLGNVEGATREDVIQEVTARLANVAKTIKPISSRKMSYRIEAKPGGGFVGYPSDPALGTVEGATGEEIQQKIEGVVAELLRKRASQLEFGDVKVSVDRKVKFVSGKEAEQLLERLQEGNNAPLPTPPPIAPESSGKILRFVIAVVVALALLYYLLHR
jgi:hypothetical protein